ncbi:MAG: DUF4159 domain-containing protein [Planctomycetia bacterium]
MRLSPSTLARATLAATLLALAAIGGACAWRLWHAVDWLAGRHPGLAEPFAAEGVTPLALAVAVVVALAAAATAAGGLAAFLPGRLALWLVRAGFWSAYVGLAAWIVVASRGVAAIGALKLTVDGLPQDGVTLFKLWWSLVGPALLPLAMALFGHVQSWRGTTIASFTRDRRVAADPAPIAAGDRIVENVRTGGADPTFRRSWLSSFSGHLAVIVIIPWLLQYLGCRERYNVPHGSGEEAVAAVVQVAKPVKKKKQKRYVLNLQSAIILTRPDLDKDSDVEEVVQEASEITYTADTSTAQARVAGKMGKGGGKTGGWPEGVGNDPIRFLRIKHAGPGWDDGMDELSRADMNFLEEFKKVTGFKIARTPEARTIQQLRNFDKGFAPPFMYLTGAGSIPVSASDVKVLREYLLDGGMLFADAGSPQFHQSFMALMAAVFPDRQVVTIADDDPLFQGPFTFPNGAPPLWHHGGDRALGVKHQNRWAVFYHPGDVNDAWKTGGSGMSRELSEQSYRLGVNILYHAFTNYLDMTRKHRK